MGFFFSVGTFSKNTALGDIVLGTAICEASDVMAACCPACIQASGSKPLITPDAIAAAKLKTMQNK